MKKRNTTLNISQENFEKYPPAIYQYYLVREADPSVVFYLHFGACQVVSNHSLSRFLTMGGREGGGAERTFGPAGGGGGGGALGGARAYFRTLAPPPPPLRSIVQNTVHEGNVVLLFFADLTIYIKM